MEVVREISAWLFLCSGAAFCVIGGIGLIRLPDVYARMHAAGVIDTAGAGLILVGLTLEPAHWTALVKLIVILFFLNVTVSPSATQIFSTQPVAGDGISASTLSVVTSTSG